MVEEANSANKKKYFMISACTEWMFPHAQAWLCKIRLDFSPGLLLEWPKSILQSPYNVLTFLHPQQYRIKTKFMKDRDKLFISRQSNDKIIHHRTKRENTSPIFSTLCATGPCKPVSQPGYDGNLPDDRPKVRNDESDNYYLYEVI
jgi:hypothetical protein